MGVAAGLALQGFANGHKGLLELDAAALGSSHHTAPGNLQQAAVHRMGDGFLLHRGVNHHAIEFAFLDRSDIHCGVDGGAEQGFQSGLAQGAAKAANLRGIAGQAWIKVVVAGKVLVVDVLGEAGHLSFTPNYLHRVSYRGEIARKLSLNGKSRLFRQTQRTPSAVRQICKKPGLSGLFL